MAAEGAIADRAIWQAWGISAQAPTTPSQPTIQPARTHTWTPPHTQTHLEARQAARAVVGLGMADDLVQHAVQRNAVPLKPDLARVRKELGWSLQRAPWQQRQHAPASLNMTPPPLTQYV